MTTVLKLRFFAFRKVSSNNNPVPKSINPAMAKSVSSQFTSFVNCIAMNGISNNIDAVINIIFALLRFYDVFTDIPEQAERRTVVRATSMRKFKDCRSPVIYTIANIIIPETILAIACVFSVNLVSMNLVTISYTLTGINR